MSGGRPLLAATISDDERIELAEAEGLAGEEGLEEDPLHAVVGKGLAVDRLALELVAPDVLAADPQVVVVGRLVALGELRPLDEIADILAIISELELGAEIGQRLDVVALQRVEGVDVVGVLADDGADDVDRVDAVAGGGGLDLADQLPIGGKLVVDRLVFLVEGAVGFGRADDRTD